MHFHKKNVTGTRRVCIGDRGSLCSSCKSACPNPNATGPNTAGTTGPCQLPGRWPRGSSRLGWVWAGNRGGKEEEGWGWVGVGCSCSCLLLVACSISNSRGLWLWLCIGCSVHWPRGGYASTTVGCAYPQIAESGKNRPQHFMGCLPERAPTWVQAPSGRCPFSIFQLNGDSYCYPCP